MNSTRSKKFIRAATGDAGEVGWGGHVATAEALPHGGRAATANVARREVLPHGGRAVMVLYVQIRLVRGHLCKYGFKRYCICQKFRWRYDNPTHYRLVWGVRVFGRYNTF